MTCENHVTFAKSFNSALCQQDGLLILVRCQAKGLSAVGFDIRPFRPEPLVRATEGNDILPLVIAVDGGVKAALLVAQHARSKVWNGNHLVVFIQEVIARRRRRCQPAFFSSLSDCVPVAPVFSDSYASLAIMASCRSSSFCGAVPRALLAKAPSPTG